MSSQSRAVNPAIERLRQKKSRRRALAVSAVVGSLLVFGYLAALEASIDSRTMGGKERLTALPQAAAKLVSAGTRTHRSHGQEAGSIGALAASLLSSSAFASQNTEGPGERAGIRERIAPVGHFQSAGTAAPAANPGEAPKDTSASLAPEKAASGEEDARKLVEGWAQAWSERAVDRYLGTYGKAFVPEKGLDRSAWEQSRRQKIGSKKSISVAFHDLKVDQEGADRLTVHFLQDYSADGFHETGTAKSLVLAREDGAWRIVAETTGTAPAKAH